MWDQLVEPGRHRQDVREGRSLAASLKYPVCREPELELETRRVVGHFDARPMKTGDGGHQAESQAIARRVATLFEPIEALEDLLILVGWNSGSVIGNRNDRAAVHGFARDND